MILAESFIGFVEDDRRDPWRARSFANFVGLRAFVVIRYFRIGVSELLRAKLLS